MRGLPLLVLLAVLVAVPVPASQGAAGAADRYQLALARDPSNGFYRYAAIQTIKRLGGDTSSLPGMTPDPNRWRTQIYEMTTGAWSIEETLQLDRLLGTGDVPGPATIPVDTIQSVGAANIPFDKLIAGRTPTVEWLARAAPADWYYTHYPSVAAMRRVLDASDRWGAHMLSSYEITGRDSRVRQRVEGQLLLKAAPEFDSLYGLVVGEVAIVGSDPFFREGSDVTVIFSVNNAMLLSAHLDKNRRDAVSAARSNVSLLHENYRDWVVDGVVTADHSVSSYASIRNRVAIVSNSFAALRRVADVVDGNARSMASADDFKYMRVVTPYSADDEDAFLFLSDDFVRRVVGPRLKIAEARRLRCATSLQSIIYSSLMFRAEKGRAPASIDELLEQKYLDKANVVCPDGGRFALAGDSAMCTVHRRLGALTPTLELPLDKVSEDEAGAYNAFRENYSNYWRRYIDPVGISVRARNKLEVRVNILPLVDNSPYRSLADSVGTSPVSLARPQLANAIGTFDVKLPKPSAEDIAKAREAGSTDRIFGVDATKLFGTALGDAATIQLADAKPTFSTDIGSGLGPGRLGPLEDWLFFTPLIAAFTLPTAVVLPIRDRSALDEVMAQFRAKLRDERRHADAWFDVEGYQIVQGGARTLETVSLRLLFLKWRVFYAIADDRLIIATQPELIDELATAPLTGDATGALRLELVPSRWVLAAPSMALSYEEDSRHVCLANVSWLEALRAAYAGDPAELEPQSLAAFGAAFSCPDNGRYIAGPGGTVACSVHGSIESPRQGPRPQPGSPAAYMLEGVRRIEATLSFTPDGLSARVLVE